VGNYCHLSPRHLVYIVLMQDKEAVNKQSEYIQ
jgi:hypothetical protein